MNSDTTWRSFAIASAIFGAFTAGTLIYRNIIDKSPDEQQSALIYQIVAFIPISMVATGWKPALQRFGPQSGRYGFRIHLISAVYHFASGITDLFLAFKRRGNK